MALLAAVPRAGQRVILAIAGPPGAGKSTLASAVVRALDAVQPGQAALLPMDGFHLENEELDARGLRAVKGAPQTFDAQGYLDLIARVRADDGPLEYPLFDRAADCSRPGAGRLEARTRIVVTEGNYLLCSAAPWEKLRDQFDARVLLSPPLEELERRLTQRWLDHGLSRESARARALGNDIPNARFVLGHSAGADLVLSL
ncbi:uridine kinase [Pseudooceanicola sp. CBS1P-1]|nr:uridine kinase [Pseudooceanicola endophyticus]